MKMHKHMSLLVLAYALGVLTSFEVGQGSVVGGYPGRSCFESEKEALLQFKRGLFDKSNYLSSWVGDDCCSWHGISCENTSTRHVIELDLRMCELRGDQILNSSLLDLKYLTYLDLSFNNFSGNKIPDFFGSFKELTYLDLSHSLFQGLVPHHLGNLSTLRHLDLSNNYVHDYNYDHYYYDYDYDSLLSIDSMRWLHGLSLEHLDLSFVNFSKAVADSFPAIDMLPNSLLVLKLHDCQLHNNIFSPLSFVNLTSLVSVDLSHNQFNHSFPLWVVNNADLVYLHLGSNNFHGPIPESMGSLSALSELDLSLNNFQGLIPQSLGNLTSLSTLDFSYNNFKGSIPESLGNLTSLSKLYLFLNRLTDSIPSELGNLTKLTHLDAYSNQLMGCLPESFCHLSKLKTLSVSKNHLSGNIPKCIGELSNLTDLYLSTNNWDGFLSEHHFTNLTRLKWLLISSKSNLVLNISSKWVPPFQLQMLYMASFKVGPSIPLWLQTQREIEDFRMQNASISIIPTNWLVSLVSYARSVDLSNNNINGRQLSIIATHRNDLEALSLSNNYLSGDFPVFICNLTSLRTLVLSKNNLSGKLPQCLGNLTKLTDLDMMDNSLSGNIPVSLGSLENLRYLNLHNNKFQGKLPYTFQNLSKLVVLDVGKNHLSDTLPLWTREQLPVLEYLILWSNSFHGKIPTQLCHHSSLHVLNLAQNQITGSIPPCFGNFSSMITGGSTEQQYGLDGNQIQIGEMIIICVKGSELQYTSAIVFLFSIDLSNNNISGEIPEELMNLHGLTNLNLTGNRLAGRIPEKIGELYKLESLDLSNNELSGPIPQNLSELNSLGSLNLSFNDLSGRIPTGKHFHTFNDLSIYAGNKQLCGQAISKPCPGDTETHSLRNHSEEITDFHSDDERIWFYAGIGPGVLVGFLGFCASLHFIKSWRYFYFHHVEKVFDKIMLAVALLQRKIINRFFM